MFCAFGGSLACKHHHQCNNRPRFGTSEIKIVVFHSFHDLVAAFAQVGFPTEVTYGVASRKKN